MARLRGSALAVAVVAALLAGGWRTAISGGPRAAVAVVAGGLQPSGPTVRDRVRHLTRESPWTLIASIPLPFRTFHPQGLVRVGGTFVVSSVEVRVPTSRYPAPIGGYDRNTGEGVGHLFMFDADGALAADVTIGEGAIYHPGGLDYDGRHIWVPLTEYRPDSHSIIYRVDPASRRATEVLRIDDSIGGVAFDRERRTLYGLSWGSRRIYAWPIDDAGRATGGTPMRADNPSHYVDYQDCKYVGAREMLCTGLADVSAGPAGPAFRLGGLDLVSLSDFRPVHQVPVGLRTPGGGAVLLQNPSWFEISPAGALRGYFIPEDDRSTLYVYEIGR